MLFTLKGICVDEGSSLLRLFKAIAEPAEHQAFIFDEVEAEAEPNCEILIAQNLIDLANAPVENEEVTVDPIPETNLSPQDSEIREIITDLRGLVFSETIEISTSNTVVVEEESVEFLDSVYNLDQGVPVKDLEIELGTSKLPRFQCACHKLNISIRRAIDMSSEISDLLQALCCSNAQVRRSINLSNTFRLKKGKLRLANATRWSSAYLMLESVKRAYDRGCYEESNFQCPVPLDTIELYLQILKPAYILTNNWQREKAGIHDVFLGISKLLFELPRFNVSGSAKEFCVTLYRCINNKFDYELNSSIYKVS